MNVSVIHTETIKPSSPTASHKKHLQQSFLDQIQQAHFIPLVYFYQWNSDVVGEREGIQIRLRKSLADTLTWYYPLAGRIKGKTLVDCNDEGVPYFETEVTGNIKDVADQRNHAVVNSLCPFSDKLEDAGDIPWAIQVNFFGCGGIAIGISANHAIGDALSIFTFMKFWSVVAHGDHNKMASPQFGLAHVFPPRGAISSHNRVGSTKEKIIGRKNFLFTKYSISSLKAKYGTRTSAEALTTFILSRFISTTAKRRALLCCVATMATNLRTRLNPPLPESHFGNASQVVGAIVLLKPEISMSIQEEAGYGSLTKLRVAVDKAGGEVVKKLQEGDRRLTLISDDYDAMMLKKFKEKEEMQLISLSFSSLGRFPVYDIDFGWGRPIWVTFGVVDLNNTFLFMPTPSGDGIEVQFLMDEAGIKCFETDKEFLTFATQADNCSVPILSSL